MNAPTADQGNKSKRIWIGLGVALVFCLCAGAASLFIFYKIGQKVASGIKSDPAAASKAAHAIADYELPDGYQEQISMDFLVYTMVMIGPKPKSSSASAFGSGPIIMLAQFQIAANRQQMEQQMRQAFAQQYGQSGTNMKLVDVKKMTIRGEQVDVDTFEGTNNNSGLVFRQLLTYFPGKHGTAMLMIMGTAQQWDQKSVDQFIESIH
jgi:hypothetical protein